MLSQEIDELGCKHLLASNQDHGIRYLNACTVLHLHSHLNQRIPQKGTQMSELGITK